MSDLRSIPALYDLKTPKDAMSFYKTRTKGNQARSPHVLLCTVSHYHGTAGPLGPLGSRGAQLKSPRLYKLKSPLLDKLKAPLLYKLKSPLLYKLKSEYL